MSNTFGITPLIPGLVNEVALEIFLHLVAVDWDGPFTLVLVCTAWRDTVLRSKFLKSLRRDRRRPNQALMENPKNVEGICIVSFDSGGPGSMSQLRMLEEFMARLAFTKKTELDELLPANYFDLMGGVGFGGLVALLLGRLRMTTTQAMEELATIGAETFPEGDGLVTTEVNMARLRKAIENMLERHGHSVDMKLRDSSGNRCKVVLFAATTAVMDYCHPFRTHQSPQKYTECTFVDSACAVVAIPEYFSSVSIGPRLRKRSFVGIPYGFDNPTKEVLKEAQLVFGEKHPITFVLSLGAGQRARISAVDHHTTRRCRIRCDGVARDLQGQLGGFGEYLRLNVDKGMEKIELDDWHDLGSIETHTEVYLLMHQIMGHIDRAVQLLLQRNGSVTLGQFCGTSTDRGVKFASEALKDYLTMEFKQMHDVVERCGIAKITLVDAIGNDIPIPTQFCVTHGMLLDVISVYFRHQKAPGSDFVERGDYRLVHGNRRSAVGVKEWTGIEKLGLKVEMSMILRTRNEDKERCPKCRARFEGHSIDGWAQCLSCPGHFQIETQAQPDADDQDDDTAQSDDDPLDELDGVVLSVKESQSREHLMRKRMRSREAVKLQFRLISVIKLLEMKAQYPEVVDNASAGVQPATVDYSEGQLITAPDGDYQVHPTARLLYDSLPLHYREVFKNCPMYPEKHFEFVKFLKTISQIDITKEDANPELLRPLGIQIPTEEGDKKKWQCPVVGCDFRDTLQHLYTHLQQKKHIDLPMFACQYCKRPFNRANDRNRHEVKIHGNGREVLDTLPFAFTPTRRGLVSTDNRPSWIGGGGALADDLSSPFSSFLTSSMRTSAAPLFPVPLVPQPTEVDTSTEFDPPPRDLPTPSPRFQSGYGNPTSVSPGFGSGEETGGLRDDGTWISACMNFFTNIGRLRNSEPFDDFGLSSVELQIPLPAVQPTPIPFPGHGVRYEEHDSFALDIGTYPYQAVNFNRRPILPGPAPNGSQRLPIWKSGPAIAT